LDGKEKARRSDLVQHLQAEGYSEDKIETLLHGLRKHKVIHCAVGRYSDVKIG
jgi:hypothetical protein